MVESLGFNGYILPSRLIGLDCLKRLFSQPIMVECSQEWSSQLFTDVVKHSKQFSANLSFYRVIWNVM